MKGKEKSESQRESEMDGEKEIEKEGNILFNDALEHILYGFRHMVKDHSDRERGNPLPSHRLLFLISSIFICIIPQTG